jgi:hypothetical protein
LDSILVKGDPPEIKQLITKPYAEVPCQALALDETLVGSQTATTVIQSD